MEIRRIHYRSNEVQALTPVVQRPTAKAREAANHLALAAQQKSIDNQSWRFITGRSFTAQRLKEAFAERVNGIGDEGQELQFQMQQSTSEMQRAQQAQSDAARRSYEASQAFFRHLRG
ncbi:MAG: hypothetical protein HYR60_29770 [Acidobacteria bacterium]|nr:hypothetical protein [Acidobacteriota bacterium]MBI3470740.1 hypothetical protein [Candidatus Solibacter usitatus]